MKRILDYITSLKSGSFEGWSEEAKKGYLTACISIEEKLKEKISLDEMLSEWVKFYDSIVVTDNEEIREFYGDVNFEHLAIGFFMSRGATLDESHELLGKY